MRGIGNVDKAMMFCADEITKKMFEGAPVFQSRIRRESAKKAKSICNVGSGALH
jgi:hypothetical protein